MSQSVKQNLKSDSQWLRLVFMVLFAVAYQVAELVVLFVVIIQALFALITGEPNSTLTQFAGGVNQFIFQILQFLTYKTDEKPFPFQDWPEPSAVVEEPSAVGNKKPSAGGNKESSAGGSKETSTAGSTKSSPVESKKPPTAGNQKS